MALRFRTRLALTNSILILLVVAVMTFAVVGMFVAGMYSQYWESGSILTRLANQNIAYGLLLPDLVEERVDDQLAINALLTAELVALAEDEEPATREKTAQALERVVQRSTALRDSIQSDFDVQGFVERFMLADQFQLIVVLDPQGNVVAAVDQSGSPGQAPVSEDVRTFSLNYLMTGTEEYRLNFIPAELGYDLGVATRIGEGDDAHVLYVQHSAAGAFANIIGRVWVIMTLGFVMFLIGILVSVLTSRSLAKPIIHLTKEVAEFAKGNLSHRVHWDRKDEFHELAETFNTMAISVQEYMHELQQETSRRERLESEFRIASQMQKTLLPVAPPSVEALELTGWSQPSREVGGDFYDYFELEPGLVVIALGDATGKGVSAALLITQCASVLRTISNDVHSPGELLRRTNDEFFKRIGATYRFVTLFVMTIDVNRRILRYACAGHPAPLLLNGDTGTHRWLECEPSFPVGIMGQVEYIEHTVTLEPQDTVVVFSDGLTDARSPEENFYGEERIAKALSSASSGSTQDVLNALKRDTESHMHGREPTDDMTVVVARFNPKVPAATPK